MTKVISFYTYLGDRLELEAGGSKVPPLAELAAILN